MQKVVYFAYILQNKMWQNVKKDASQKVRSTNVRFLYQRKIWTHFSEAKIALPKFILAKGHFFSYLN